MQLLSFPLSQSTHQTPAPFHFPSPPSPLYLPPSLPSSLYLAAKEAKEESSRMVEPKTKERPSGEYWAAALAQPCAHSGFSRIFILLYPDKRDCTCPPALTRVTPVNQQETSQNIMRLHHKDSPGLAIILHKFTMWQQHGLSDPQLITVWWTWHLAMGHVMSYFVWLLSSKCHISYILQYQV